MPVVKTATEGNSLAIVRVQLRLNQHAGEAVIVAGSVNKYCESRHLTNEASVETLFLDRLISDLGFTDHQIKFKSAIDKKRISIGSKRLLYRPDYILYFDAKSPDEHPSDYILQAASYAWMLNSAYAAEKPVEYFVLSNGFVTQVYAWDSRDPILELDFEDFVDGNSEFIQLKALLSAGRFGRARTGISDGPTHKFNRHSLKGINSIFGWCHQHIYKKGHISQAAGFEEFVKVVFLKLLSD